MNTTFPYDRQKAAEGAAEFIRLAGGKINILKLTKLMYLLDRASLEKIGVPVVGGRYVSMKHGPVTSQVLNAINRANGEGSGPWESMISERKNHDVRLSVKSDAPHLSSFEKGLIQELHEEHKHKNQFELRDWCHENCHEWTPPKLWGSPAISTEALAAEIKRTKTELETAMNEAAFMEKVFSLA